VNNTWSSTNHTMDDNRRRQSALSIEENNKGVGNFWFDDTFAVWNKGSDFSFLVREFVNETTTPWMGRNKDIVKELFFFFLLIGIGSIVVVVNWSEIQGREFFASILFVSGFIPFIQSTLFDKLPRLSKNLAKKITADDVLSVALSAIFVGVGVFLYPEDRWDLVVVGKTFFEAGLIYFVTRVLLFAPNPSNEVRNLKNEIKQLKQSMAIGLADGYFWDRVREISIDIQDAKRYGLDGGKLRLEYHQREGGDVLKHVERFLILIPRELDWSNEDPIAALIQGYKEAGCFKDCEIQKSPRRAESSRVKRVTDIIASDDDISFINNDDNDNDKNDITYDADLGKRKEQRRDDGIIIDIPTALTAMLMSMKAESKGGEETIDIDKFQKEVSIFSCRLAWHLKKEKMDKYAKVIEINDTKDLMQKLFDINRFLNKVNYSQNLKPFYLTVNQLKCLL